MQADQAIEVTHVRVAEEETGKNRDRVLTDVPVKSEVDDGAALRERTRTPACRLRVFIMFSIILVHSCEKGAPTPRRHPGVNVQLCGLNKGLGFCQILSGQ